MKFMSGVILSCVLVSTLLTSGCATAPSSSTQTVAVVEPRMSSSPASTKVLPSEVPQLKIVNACGSCVVHETVADLIRKGYASAAEKSGMKVTTQSEATLSITTYTQRPPGLRVMFGAFAGKDEIKASVTYQDKTFEIEDYFRNAWLGMNALSENIGALVFEKIR